MVIVQELTIQTDISIRWYDKKTKKKKKKKKKKKTRRLRSLRYSDTIERVKRKRNKQNIIGVLDAEVIILSAIRERRVQRNRQE